MGDSAPPAPMPPSPVDDALAVEPPVAPPPLLAGASAPPVVVAPLEEGAPPLVDAPPVP
ncbi:hypothetical protein [Sorangium sp. So ce1335]|uniref:hypothetical protein n=1 Tax=Sorangium sp. So ce1335 TaxID=3133335 RepID=UPI003F5FE578